MSRKTHIFDAIFKRWHSSPKSVEGKLDDLINCMHATGNDNEDIFILHQRFTEAVKELPGYKAYLEQREKDYANLNDPLLMVSIQRNRRLLRRKRKGKKRMSNTFRILVSLLIITFGFAMIILPAPPYFEMFTIFYFNEQDGFTLMDLISLIIIFAGIYTLVTAVYHRNRD